MDTETVPCPICQNNTNFEILYRKDRYGLNVTTVKCPQCSFVFSQPMPTESFLNKFYSSKMFRGLDWGIIFITDRVRKEFSAPERANKHLDFIKHLMGQRTISKDVRSVLDIGSSEGSFLLGMLENYPNVATYAVEPGQNFRHLTEKKFRKIYNSLSEVDPNDKFDVITMWHVLEHVRDPLKILHDIKKHMSPESLLIFEIPDLDKYFGIGPIHVDHVVHFNAETIRKTLGTAGFDVVTMTGDKQFVMDERYGIKVVARVCRS
ncbi:MAG: hypothetical protein AB200_01645 [Parcubacteria bacterium C7867-005]|nr:MAG: hypothetical protein AB200_01645 [Parcubacteria bacterium C7867-005]